MVMWKRLISIQQRSGSLFLPNAIRSLSLNPATSTGSVSSATATNSASRFAISSPRFSSSKAAAAAIKEPAKPKSKKSPKLKVSKAAQKAKEAEKIKQAKAKARDKALVQKTKEAEKMKLQKLKEKAKRDAEKKKAAIPSSRAIVTPPSVRNLSSYIVFTSEELSRAKDGSKAGTPEHLSQIMKDRSEIWKRMSDREKQVYAEKAKVVNAERAKKLEKWWASIDLNLVALENQRRKKINASGKREGKAPLAVLADPRKPKKPLSTFFIFNKELTAAQGGSASKSIIELVKEHSAKWKQLSESEKRVYTDKYNIALAEYKEKLDEYKKSYLLPKTA